MTELAKYPHCPLRYDDSIRLMHLQPAAGENDSIEFSLQDSRLSDANLGYEALSYTCGADHPKQLIFCQDPSSILQVTQNCYGALKRLRNDSVRCLWIDAICINQDDETEKSIQVRMMDRVFARASRVIVDLGEATPGSCRIFNELAEAENSKMPTGKYDKPKPSDELVGELERLFRHPWFSRVWVIQEVVVNHCVGIMCGSQEGSWDALKAFQFGHGSLVLTWKEDPPVLRLSNLHLEDFKLSNGLWRLLLRTRSLSASDPRDRVLALLSLLGSQLDIRKHLIDYTQNCEAIFTSVALLLLQRVGLELLITIRHGHARAMASWVPDWSQKHHDCLVHSDTFNNWGSNAFEVILEEQAAQGIGSEAKQVQDTEAGIAFKSTKLLDKTCPSKYLPILKVKGVRIGAIVCQGAPFSFTDHDDAHRALAEALGHFYSVDCGLNLAENSENIHFQFNLLAGKRGVALSLLE